MKKLIIILVLAAGAIAVASFFYKLNAEFKKANTLLQDFKSFEDSFKVHSRTADDKLREQYAKKHDPKALLLKNKSEEIIRYLDATKVDLIKAAGERGETDQSRATQTEKGGEIRKKLQDYKDFINAEFNGHTLNIDSLIPVNGRKEGKRIIKWETENFEHSPLAAVATILTYYENQIKTVEQVVLKQLD